MGDDRPHQAHATRAERPDDVDDRALADVLSWLVAELGGDGVMVADDDGYVVLADSRAEAWFGYATGELRGRRVADLVSDPAAALFPAPAPAHPDHPGRSRRLDARLANGAARSIRLGTKAVATRRGRFHVLTILESADGSIAGEVPAATSPPARRVVVIGPVDVRDDSVLATLDAAGSETIAVQEVRDALALLESERPDAVIIDDDRSQASLLDAVRLLRAASGIPIIVVSPRAEEDERVGALRLGADDYLTKPFSAAELAERVRVVVRRAWARAPVESLTFDDLVLEFDARRVTVAGREVQLSPIEFDLLVFLARRPRHVFSRAELLRHVWGSRADRQTEATVTEHVRRLRRKVEPDPNAPRRIVTVHRAGYRFDP